jgi:site-specific DNA-methyltransferase (cytosine-N4-specific)
MKTLPSHTQLALPLVEVIAELGGGKPKDICAALADRIGLPDPLRDHTVAIQGRTVPTWERRVRWVRQQLVAKNYIADDRFAFWKLTDAGKEHLHKCKPGVVVTVYESNEGVVLWAQAQAAAQTVAKNSLNLIFTSPPYPLLRKKSYGNLSGTAYLDWLLDHAKTWRELLTDDGSLFLNLGDVWQAGLPVQDLYKERLLLNLCDRLGYHLAEYFYWHNPAKIPSSEWVTVRRCRVTPAVEPIFWLSKTAHPKANNREVLQPYSERMVKLLARGGETNRTTRPSGHGNATQAFGRDNGGSIPHNLLIAHNADSNSAYFRYCREHALPIHPARFPAALPEFAVKLTTEPGDICADFFGGSLQLAATALGLGRRVITSDQSLAYLRGGASRLTGFPGFRELLPPHWPTSPTHPARAPSAPGPA